MGLIERFKNIRTIKDLVIAIVVLICAGIVFSVVMGLLYKVLPVLSILWRILGIIWDVICIICIVFAVLGFMKSIK